MKEKKKESAISRQTAAQRKMNEYGSFETEHFFFSLTHIKTIDRLQTVKYKNCNNKSLKNTIQPSLTRHIPVPISIYKHNELVKNHGSQL